MVFGLPVRIRTRLEDLKPSGAALLLLASCLFLAVPAGVARAEEPSVADFLRDAKTLYSSGQYFKAARYAFSAKEDPALSPEAYSWVTLGLARARLFHSASYFFIKTLQTGNKAAIRRVLTETQDLLLHLGGDIFRKYLIRHTQFEDYDAANRSAYLYSLGKEALLSRQEDKAVGYLSSVSTRSPLWPYALQLRGSAHALLGKSERALSDFKACVANASDSIPSGSRDTAYGRQAAREADDLQARCVAGQARTLYQMERFDDADQMYDQIAKASMVWPDILFEQGWNSFARSEYNRTLGRLVSYKSPALKFVFNPEIDVLRAQSYLALCLYADANEVVNEFNGRYAKVGEHVKQEVEAHTSDPGYFYSLGKQALRSSLYTENQVLQMSNRFVRGPYFRGLVASERALASELAAIRQFDASQAGVDHDPAKGFPGFLDQVLKWKAYSVKLLGGAFVKNSLMDYHAALLENFDKMSFIKLEMLKRAKDQLIFKNSRDGMDRMRGNVVPERRDYQYYWSFNGEFWNDELGDYVFGLESECRGKDGV